MENKMKFNTMYIILSLLITLPIWFYLLYKILKAVNATELMMFLFWIYMPVQIVVFSIGRIYADD